MENSLQTGFRGRPLPVAGMLAGYSALIARYDLSVPLHHEMVAISSKNLRHKADGWMVLPSSLRPSAATIDNLVFALKYEGIQLLTLKKTFEAFDINELAHAALEKPTSAYLRRLCHLYEWLIGKEIDIPDVAAGTYVDLVDGRRQYAATRGDRVRRFRITHNLPGARSFCPTVFKTRRIEAYLANDLSRKARHIVESAPPDLIARAAAFLLLSDSRASFAIEGENPPKDRLARWGFAVGKAGNWHLDVENLVQLQRTLIGDARFVHIGLRSEGGFVGRHDSMSQPVPEHISARAEDIRPLLEGLVTFCQTVQGAGVRRRSDSRLCCFRFRLHPSIRGRQRPHSSLPDAPYSAERGFTPAEIVFPISSVILDEVVGYKAVLERIAKPLLELIEWAATERGNVRVLNDTMDYYSFFDATAHCEFLFECIARSVERDLPEELGFLEHRDAFHRDVTEIVDMGERILDLLLRFLKQNHGILSKRARTREFAALNEDEVQQIQSIYANLFQPRIGPQEPV